MRKKDKALITLLVVTIIAMISLLCFGIWSKKAQRQVIYSYTQEVKDSPQVADTELEKAEKYNQDIQDFLAGRLPAGKSNSQQVYKQIFSKNDGMIGVLTIPKINTRLPIYHGTEDSVLDKGVGHVLGTAFPLDTPGTKSVLTGHNGMPGADMLFTRLDEMKAGDTFAIQVGDVGYQYKIKQLVVMTPQEAETYAQTPIKLDDPQNVTLITCTPYGLNTHRLLVIGEFISKDKVSENPKIIPQIGFSLGKETIFILSISVISALLIIFVIHKARKKVKDEA